MRALFDIDAPPNTPDGASNEFYTPAWIIAAIQAGAGVPIDLDPAAAPCRNTGARRYIVGQDGDDGLAESWTSNGASVRHGDGEPIRLVYCNPPYRAPTREERSKLPPHVAVGSQEAFLRKARSEVARGHVETVVLLVQQAALATGYGHACLRDQATIGLVHGRIAFVDAAGRASAGVGTFASMLAIFSSNPAMVLGIRDAFDAVGSRRGHPVWWIHAPAAMRV